MGDSTADESDDDSDDEGESIVWQSVSRDGGDDTDADDRGGEDGPFDTEEPQESDATDESAAGDRETVDLEALIAEDPSDTKGESTDRTDEPESVGTSSPVIDREPSGRSGDRGREHAERSPADDERDHSGAAGADDERKRTGESAGRSRGRSDRLWNRFGSEDRDSSTQSRSASEEGTEDARGEESGDADRTASADTTDSDRLWNRDEPGDTGGERPTRAETESGEDATAQTGGTTDVPEERSGGTSFDHLLERSSSGPGRSRPAGSPTVETDLEAFFGDLEEFDRATSGSQVLVISPRGHTIGDEVCSHFLTAGGVSTRNAMFVTAVDPPAERLAICRDTEDWAGGNVAVIELGDTGSNTDDLGSVGGEAVTYKRVNSPKNLSKAGLLITQTLKEWSSSDRPSILCFHTLTAVSGYVQNQTLFQFLFTLQAKLNSFGVTGHYHMDANRHDQQEINTLKTLFDLVVTITQNGEIEVE